MNLLIVLLVFLCVAMFVYALLTGVQIVKVKVAEQEFTDSEEDKLVKAGSPLNGIKGNQFLGLLVLSAVFIFVFNLVSMTFIGGLSFFNFVFSLVAGVVTFVVGNMWLNDKITDRKIAIAREFPYFVDMSVMVMGAGSSFPDAMKIYTSENSNTALGGELKIVLNESEMGKTMLECLEGFESRVESTGVQNALKAILQGERMGTPVIDNLVEQADAIRFLRSQEAERVAEQMKIKMQGPAMLLLFSVLLIILGPAVVNFKDSGMF